MLAAFGRDTGKFRIAMQIDQTAAAAYAQVTVAVEANRSSCRSSARMLSQKPGSGGETCNSGSWLSGTTARIGCR